MREKIIAVNIGGLVTIAEAAPNNIATKPTVVRKIRLGSAHRSSRGGTEMRDC